MIRIDIVSTLTILLLGYSVAKHLILIKSLINSGSYRGNFMDVLLFTILFQQIYYQLKLNLGE
jgi:hypothetical protein